MTTPHTEEEKLREIFQKHIPEGNNFSYVSYGEDWTNVCIDGDFDLKSLINDILSYRRDLLEKIEGYVKENTEQMDWGGFIKAVPSKDLLEFINKYKQ